MARVLLFNFSGYPYTPSSLMPDNGLASLAGALLADGHEVRIHDYSNASTLEHLFPRKLADKVKPLARRMFVDGKKLSAMEKLRFLRAGWLLDRHQQRERRRIAFEAASAALEFDADVVGLKLWNGDGFMGSVEIAEAVRKELPGAFVIGGGPQVDYFGHHILKYTDAFHALLRAEGERTLPMLVRRLAQKKSWKDLPGLIWKDHRGLQHTKTQVIEDLDNLPLPCYDPEVYPAMFGNEKIKIGVIDESRGCPNRCAFCIHPVKSGGRWRVKSPKRVISELNSIMKQIETHYFIYSGSNTSARVAFGIAEELLAREMDIRYGCFGHVKGIGNADFDLLRRSGCLAIFYGLESGNRRILKEAFNKPLDLESAEHVLKQTAVAGIRTIASVIYPAPFEDRESRSETLSFLRRVWPDSVPVTIPGIIPGTPWDVKGEQYGFKKSRRKDLWNYGLTYKIKLLFPPSMWKPLPYTLNDKSSKQLFRECSEFVDELERSGILTNVPHELVLMADALGEGENLRGFRDRCRAMFLSGDTEAIREMVSRINCNVVPEKRGALEALAGVDT